MAEAIRVSLSCHGQARVSVFLEIWWNRSVSHTPTTVSPADSPHHSPGPPTPSQMPSPTAIGSPTR